MGGVYPREMGHCEPQTIFNYDLMIASLFLNLWVNHDCPIVNVFGCLALTKILDSLCRLV